MKSAETVTFGGSGLNRAAEERENADALAKETSSETIVLWRGKLLSENGALIRLSMDHPVLKDSSLQIFLGSDDVGAIFATDISTWAAPDMNAEEMKEFFDQSINQHPDLPKGKVFAELRGIMTELSPRDAELAATSRAMFEWHRSHGFCANCGVASNPALGGWQRNCPSCERAHFPRTDPVVIMLITSDNDVLVGRSHHWPNGMYSLLAGFVEPGETIEAAVRRETFEEAGIEVGSVSYLASQPWAFPNSLMFGCAGEALNRDINIDPHEIDDAIWVSKETMLDVFAGVDVGIQAARKGSIAHFLIRNWLEDRLNDA